MSLLALFTSKPALPSLYGLDSNPSSIYLIALHKKHQQFSVLDWAIEPILSSALNHFSDKQTEQTPHQLAAIQRASTQLKTSLKNVVIAMRSPAVIIKTITLASALSAQDQEEQILADAEQHIPFPMSEVMLDFWPRKNYSSTLDTQEILIAACRHEHIQKNVSALTQIGLHTSIVDVEMLALENSACLLQHQMPNHGHEKTIALINLVAHKITLIILHNLESVYSSEHVFDAPSNLYQKEIISYMQRALNLFYSSAQKLGAVEQIILAGDMNAIADLCDSLSEALVIPTVTAKPLEKTTL